MRSSGFSARTGTDDCKAQARPRYTCVAAALEAQLAGRVAALYLGELNRVGSHSCGREKEAQGSNDGA